MKCKIEKCEFEGKDLTKHIICKHCMFVIDYIKKYGNDIVDEGLKQQRAESRKNKYVIKCLICHEKFQSEKSLECHFKNSEDIAHNHFYYNETNKDSWVECNICRLRDYSINKHIEKHNVKVSDYKGELRSKQCIEDLDLKNKERRENTFQFKCSVQSCSQNFKTERALSQHLINSKDVEHNHVLYNDQNKDEWVECKICTIRKTVLTIHLKNDHDMSVEYYKENYKSEVFSNNYLEKYNNFILAGAHADKEHVKKYFCNVCNKGFSTENILNEHKEEEHSCLFNNDLNKNDWVECKVENCGYRAARIDLHLKSKHNMSLEEYKQKYNSEVLSKTYLEKINSNWGDLKENAQKRKSKEHKCVIENCNNIIVGEKNMCVNCTLKLARIKQEEKFKDKTENIDFVRCKCKLENGEVCGWPDTRISEHILYHNMNTQDYKKAFDSPVICSSVSQKTAFRGTHSEETKKKMGISRKYLTPWNKGLTKDDNPSLKSISDKAIVRLSQLSNNNWHTNPISGTRNGMYGRKTWSFGLSKQTSELIEERDENNSGIYQHKSHFGRSDIYDLNKFVEKYIEIQKEKVKSVDKRCFQCGKTEDLHVHHIHPNGTFDNYDLTAHSHINLITLCNRCHGGIGQEIDKAILSSKSVEDMQVRYPYLYEVYLKWLKFTEKRFVSCFPLEKNFVEKLDENQRSKLSLMILLIVCE